MTRFWVSWVSGNYADEGCTKPPFPLFETGALSREDGSERTDLTLCAILEADTEARLWETITRYFPDCGRRFIQVVAPDWLPGDRFPGARACIV